DTSEKEEPKQEDTDNLDDLESILDDDTNEKEEPKQEDTDNLDDLDSILDDNTKEENNNNLETALDDDIKTQNADELENNIDNNSLESNNDNLMVENVAGNVRIIEEENTLPSPDSADSLGESKYEDVDKDINDDEVIDNIKRLSPITRYHVLDAILNEKLSKNSMQKLLKALEKGESNEYITDFINNELGLSISDSRGGLLDIIPIPSSLKEYAKIIRIAAIFLVLFVGVVLFSYQFIYKPVLANRYFKMGLENIYNSQFDEAERNFAKGDRLTPKKIKWYNKYAKEYIDRSAFDYALKKLETSVDIKPRNIDTRLLFGYYYRNKGEKELSEEDYNSGEELYNNLMTYTDKEKDLKRIYDDLGVLMISRAKTLVEPNYYNNAYENYREMINKFGDNVIPRKRVMLIKIYQDNYQDVKDLQNHINRLKNGYIDDDVYPKLAKYLLDKDDFYGARKLFEKLLAKYTNNLESIVGYADYEARLKHYDRAKEILINSALPLYTSNPYNVGEEYVYNMLGQIYYNLKEYGSAINNFKLALEKNSLYPDANFNLANLYFYQDNDYKKAKEHYKIAYDNLAPDLRSDQLLYNLSWLYYLDGEYDLAFQGFNDLFYKNPDNSIVSYALGNSLLHLDRANLANGFYRNALNKALESRRDKFEMRTEKDFMFISYLASLHNNIGVSYAYNSVVSNKIENEQMAFKNFVVASEYFDQLRTSNIDLDMAEKRTVNIDNQNIGASKYNMMAIQSKRNLKNSVIIDDYIPKTMFNLK
ncbi:periplasmic flagellar collar protein FlcA, partial [Brachyspira pilosicoli]